MTSHVRVDARKCKIVLDSTMAEPKHASKSTKYLGKYCVAGGPNNESCKNNSTTPGISMHEFPKPGNRLRSLWIKFVRRHRMADWQPSPYSCLCSAHFEQQCFHQRLDLGLEIGSNITTKRLLDRSCAVPTIDTVQSDRNPQLLSQRERRQVKYCITYTDIHNLICKFHVRLV